MRLSELPVQKLLAGVAGSEEQGRVIYEALGGDLSRLPELVQHLDTLPGIGGGTAFRVAAALELAARAGGHRSGRLS